MYETRRLVIGSLAELNNTVPKVLSSHANESNPMRNFMGFTAAYPSSAPNDCVVRYTVDVHTFGANRISDWSLFTLLKVSQRQHKTGRIFSNFFES